MQSSRWERVSCGVFLIRVHHVQLLDDLSVGICKDRVRHLAARLHGEELACKLQIENLLIQKKKLRKTYSVGFNILDPLVVGLHIITRQSHELHPSPSKLRSMRRHLAKFRSADRREIAYMRTHIQDCKPTKAYQTPIDIYTYTNNEEIKHTDIANPGERRLSSS
jgi:hypothetical protein